MDFDRNLKFIAKGVGCGWLFFAAIVWSCTQEEPVTPIQEIHGVRVLDSRLSLSRMLEDPDIVTPIGIAVDAEDRVYVLESHTHLPPNDYAGPSFDRIKRFADTNGDGQWDELLVFADSITEGLNLAISPAGELHVITSREVWVLYDRDGDGISEERRLLVGLERPEQVYAHAAMLSIAFDASGHMYLGRGNTGSAHWVLAGSDGSKVSGYGDGGNIVRADADGSNLEIFSTGYWNPFDLKFDSYGRLMVADNDPDSRGPNRLVHAVEGSDFGYKSLFGGSGIHPYLSWNGELPGTLPYAVALGEAPSGLLNTNLTAFPDDFKDQLLCSIWEESRVVRINLADHGMSVRGEVEVVLEGGVDFRPVAFAADSKGNVYFTDWVMRYYPNHGKGRVWKLSANDHSHPLVPEEAYQAPRAHPSQAKWMALREGDVSPSVLEAALRSWDAFERHAAVLALGMTKFQTHLQAALTSPNALERLGALLAKRRMPSEDGVTLARSFLSDPDPDIRTAALIWVGEEGFSGLSADIARALSGPGFSVDLFETYLETVKMLQPAFLQAYQQISKPNAKQLPRALPQGFLSDLIADADTPTEWKSAALALLENPLDHRDVLVRLLSEEEDAARMIDLIRTLARSTDPVVADVFADLAFDPGMDTEVRAEALWALGRQSYTEWQNVISLLQSSEEAIAIEAARFLRFRSNDPATKQAMVRVLEDGSSCDSEGLRQQLMLSLYQDRGKRPESSDLAAWQALLDGQGDVFRGRRVFYSAAATCAGCHAYAGLGGDLGPDLSHVGQSKDRRGLLSSLLLPSQEVSPEWQGWFITTKDGKRYEGRQIDVGDSDIKLYTQHAGFISVLKSEVLDYGLVDQSLMPEGLLDQLTDQDIMDLLAFLESEKNG
ncbi:MAG: c-type cytochrome [Lunatimonas sp.]|uniref:PVC-type heme-binding CxxCH protein n=1 Tax=Lunatimonas sp. TaxID=2060141 RepID=UPI00263A3FD4|nr:PVC-type heme-binding CxxCH protein [Lunatimonas sp.]MCC5938102.1 c-type cytochrome [Lunatimonas sp.]